MRHPHECDRKCLPHWVSRQQQIRSTPFVIHFIKPTGILLRLKVRQPQARQGCLYHCSGSFGKAASVHEEMTQKTILAADEVLSTHDDDDKPIQSVTDTEDIAV